ncbi:hypothetical protein NTE19_003406 [Vibrio fluvialis]|nr:hypothetical protein [Vibrio fluvialis]
MEDKSAYLANRIALRNDTHESLAERMLKDLGVDPQESPEVVSSDDSPAPIPVCAFCGGKGKVQGLFSKSDCFSCDGTGYDMSDPVRVVKHQKQLLEWARGAIVKARRDREAALDTRTDEEKHAAAVESFYKDSSTRRND